MTRYRKKPVVIEAEPWDGTVLSANGVLNWIIGNGGTARWHGPVEADPDCPVPTYHETHRYCPACSFVDEDPALRIDTLEGTVSASPGDFIIRGVQGEFYPCKPDIFATTYEEVTE